MSGQLIILLVTAGVFMTLVMLIFALTDNSSEKLVAKRMLRMRERYANYRDVSTQMQSRRSKAKKSKFLDNFFASLIPNRDQLKTRLEKAGKTWTISQYGMGASLVMLVATLALKIIGLPFLLCALLGLVAAAFLPNLYINRLIKKRVARFNTLFPDAIDLIVRGLRSGLPISESLHVVSKEIPEPIGSEFRIVCDKIRIGRTMEQALQELSNKIELAEFQFFVITLAIQRETGGNLAETLSNLSEVLRKRAAMKLKVKAMSAESKMSAYIVGSLPFLVFAFINVSNPEYASAFKTDLRLMIIGAGALVWMGIGVFVMSKMVSFEI